MSLTACIKKAAKAISPDDAQYLSQARSEFMQEGMTAVEADRAAVESLLDVTIGELKELSSQVEMQGGQPLYQEIETALASRKVTDRTSELQEGIQQLDAGNINQEQYAELVDRFKPVAPYESVPEPEQDDKAVAALSEDKQARYGAARGIEEGTPVAVRLDIPAYRDNNTWVVSIHEQREGKGQSSFQAGKSIGYDSTAVITDVEFGMPQKGAMNIAKGKPKGTIATMKGSWRNVSAAEAKAMADQAMASGEYIQVGMDPERHSFFYDRGDHRVPVLAAEEVIQVGPLVLAKNPTLGNKEDFLFSRTGKPAMDPVQLDSVISRVAPGWEPGNPGSPVVVVDTFADLPRAVQQIAEAQDAVRADGTSEIDGAFHDGKVYLVREEIGSEEQAETVLLHEASHGGMMAAFKSDSGRYSSDLYRATNELWTAVGGSSGYAKIADELGITARVEPYKAQIEGMPEEYGRFVMLAEMVAYQGEKGSKGLMTKIREFIGAIRNWLRSQGFAKLAEMDANDIANLAKRSREVGLSGQTGVNAPVLFSRRKSEQLGEFTAYTTPQGGLFVEGDVDAIRAKLPDGVLGTRTEGGLKFTPNKAPRVQAALSDGKISYGRAGKVTKNVLKDGKYVGAPAAYNTPAKLPQMKKRFKQLALEGERGRFWYENSGEAILQMTAGNVEEAKKFVALLAIYSPQAKVDANSTFALRAWAQYQAGKPIKVKTGNQDAQATAILYDGAAWGGEKTNNFFQNLLREIEPDTAGKQGATIDMWMMRAAGYDHDAPNDSEYRFVENETNRLSQELGWEPQQVQAAIWVAMKARMENKGVKQRTEARSEKDGYLHYTYPEKNGKPKKTRNVTDERNHMLNWIDEAMKHTPTEQDTNAAKFDFGDGVRRHIGQISWEATPSTKIDVLPGIHNASYEDKLDFQLAVQNVLYDENGRDKLAYQLGLLVDTNDTVVPGYWEGISNPSNQTQVAVAPDVGSNKESDPAQKDMMDVYAAAMGLMLNQDGVGYHRPFYKAAKKDSHGIELQFGRPLSGAEVTAIGRGIEEVFGDTAPAIGIISTPDGVRLVDFTEMGYKKFGDMMEQVLSSAELNGSAEMVHFAFDGNLVENNWEASDAGQDYIETIRGKGRSDILGFIASEFAQPLQEVYDSYSAEFDWGNPGNVRERLEQTASEAGVTLLSRKRESTFTVPEEGVADRFIRRFQDKFLQVQRVQRAIERSSGRKLENEENPYLMEQFFTGKAEQDLEAIERNYIKPIMDLMGANDISMDELSYYLIARHAPERNATVAERRTPKPTEQNPNPESEMPDGGSGMTNQQAADWMLAFEREDKLGSLKEITKYVDGLVAEQRKLMGDLELVTEGQRYMMENSWQYYVPLKGFADDAESDGIELFQKRGKGFDIRGKEYKSATGRNSMPDHPLVMLLADTTEKIIRGRKNEVGQTFLKMVENNPNPELYEILKPEDLPKGYNGELDADGKAAKRVINLSADPQILAVKRKGEVKYIKIHDKRLAKAMKNMGPVEMDGWVQIVNTGTRFLSSINTSLSPEFPVTNAVRDIQTAMYNVLAETSLEDGKIKGMDGVATAMAKDALPAMKVINDFYNARNADPDYQPEGMAADFAEFLEMGAKTGYFDSKDIEQLKADLNNMFEMASGTTKGKYLKAQKKVFDKIEQWNTSVENGVRLSAYKHARDAIYKAQVDAGVDGATAYENAKVKAADLAKNLTVNFNRKGEVGQTLNAFYMFANASIQGSMNMLRAVSPMRRDPDGDFKINPNMNTAQKLAAGMVGVGYALSMLNREMGGEDEDGVPYWDKIPVYERERNLIILDSVWGGDGKDYFKFPLPYGFNLFFNIGDVAEAAMSSEYLPRRRGLVGQLAFGTLNSFSPIGSPSGENLGTSTALTLMPSLAVPVVELVANESQYTGGPIYKEPLPFGAQPVAAHQSFRTTKQAYRDITEYLNDATGGSEYIEGAINWSPDAIEHIVEYAMGGLYRTGSRFYETISASAQGRYLSPNSIPYARTFRSENQFYEDQGLFYDRLTDIEAADKQLKAMRGPERARFRRERKWQIKLAERGKGYRKRYQVLNEQRDELMASDQYTAAEKDKRVREVEGRMKDLRDRFNSAYNEAERRSLGDE